ncbi:MAG: hypothetical protein QM778_16935 [Myxococcales bacterium]
MNELARTSQAQAVFSHILRASAFAALLFSTACGDSGSDGPPAQQVEDMSGRSCSVQDAFTVSCDVDPMPTGGCQTGETACFQLGTTGDASGPGAICAACCKGNTSRSIAADCVNLVCSTADDCPPEYGRCVSSICRY